MKKNKKTIIFYNYKTPKTSIYSNEQSRTGKQRMMLLFQKDAANTPLLGQERNCRTKREKRGERQEDWRSWISNTGWRRWQVAPQQADCASGGGSGDAAAASRQRRWLLRARRGIATAAAGRGDALTAEKGGYGGAAMTNGRGSGEGERRRLFPAKPRARWGRKSRRWTGDHKKGDTERQMIRSN